MKKKHCLKFGSCYREGIKARKEMNFETMEKKIVIIAILAVVSLAELIALLTITTNKEFVDLSKSTCTVSVNLGRRIFFHRCFKDKTDVYDIRKFFYNGTYDLQPEVQGVQLLKNEFVKLCAQC